MDSADIIQRCQKDPEFFVRNVLGGDPWPTQVAIMDSVRDHDHTAVPSCHSSGKSWVASRIALWFLYSFPDSKVITTAPTERQAKGILWSEMHKAKATAKYPLGGDSTSMQIKLDEDWWALGFTAPDYDPNRFQGFHAPHILVLVDESAGISKAISEQIDSLLSGGHARRLDIGNPVEAGTPFQASCESPMVNTIPISAFDTPNFTEFGITEDDIVSDTWQEKIGDSELPRPVLIDPKWVASRYAIWGNDSDAWKSRVLGQFPDVVEGAYYGELMKTAALEGRITSIPYDDAVPVQTAWDIGVRDSTSIWFYQRQGDWVNVIDYEEDTGQGLPHYAKVLQDKGYTYTHVQTAPHDIKNREWASGKSRMEVARSLGIVFRPIERVVSKLGGERAEGIDAVRRLLPRVRFDAEKCADGIACLQNYRRKKNARTGEFSDEPEHDWASHGADAFRYLAMGLRQTGKVNRPAPKTSWVQ